jgi:hypothetical protein
MALCLLLNILVPGRAGDTGAKKPHPLLTTKNNRRGGNRQLHTDLGYMSSPLIEHYQPIEIYV